MALDFTGIFNEIEFYFEHYLSVLLEVDLKELFSQWNTLEKERRESSPAGKLRQLASTWPTHRRILIGKTGSAEREKV